MLCEVVLQSISALPLDREIRANSMKDDLEPFRLIGAARCATRGLYRWVSLCIKRGAYRGGVTHSRKVRVIMRIGLQ
jgi:hypothetical protein